MNTSFLYQPIAYLKGVGPVKATFLQSELNIFTVYDLLNHYPLRHLDKSAITPISAISPDTDFIQIKGIVKDIQLLGNKFAKRVVVSFQDNTGSIELIWFQGVQWVLNKIKIGQYLLVFGKINFFNNKPNISHP
ncbi:MAG: OB-fold nucleic acid binding domain-containing protein, partial [Sediminibacterium sp.]|nr:OB-fold nucleic acid binding domain-containing protein [Sediminibacterium sp.]